MVLHPAWLKVQESRVKPRLFAANTVAAASLILEWHYNAFQARALLGRSNGARRRRASVRVSRVSRPDSPLSFHVEKQQLRSRWELPAAACGRSWPCDVPARSRFPVQRNAEVWQSRWLICFHGFELAAISSAEWQIGALLRGTCNFSLSKTAAQF